MIQRLRGLARSPALFGTATAPRVLHRAMASTISDSTSLAVKKSKIDGVEVPSMAIGGLTRLIGKDRLGEPNRADTRDVVMGRYVDVEA